jgi:hypothetical protein
VLDTDVEKCAFEVGVGDLTEVRATVSAEVIARVQEHLGEIHAFWFHAAGKSWLSDPVVEIESGGRVRMAFAGKFDYPTA